MNEQLVSMLTDQYLQADCDVVEQVLTMHLGKAPGKVDEFLIEKIHPFKHSPDYALHFDGFLLGYVKFGIDEINTFVEFQPAVLDDQINSVRKQVNEGLISEKESEKRVNRLVDHWFEVDGVE